MFLLKLANLTTAGQDDSSSEETQSNLNQITAGKPVVPPRPRSTLTAEHKSNGLLSSEGVSKYAKDINLADNEPGERNYGQNLKKCASLCAIYLNDRFLFPPKYNLKLEKRKETK